MEKVQKTRGRPSTRIAKFPIQKVKMKKVLDYLVATGQIRGMEDIANILKIRRETLTNWSLGQIEIDQLVKFSFSYLYKIQESFWDAPEDASIEDYLENTSSNADFSKAAPSIVQWNPLLDPFSSQVSHNKYSLEAQQTARYWRVVIFQATEPEQQRKFARWKRLLFDMVDAAMEHLEEPIVNEEARIISRNQSNEAVARMLDNLRKRDQRTISHPVNVPEEITKGSP